MIRERPLFIPDVRTCPPPLPRRPELISGRSSDFRIILLQRLPIDISTVAYLLNSSPVTAAGPSRIHTGFPFHPRMRTPETSTLYRMTASKSSSANRKSVGRCQARNFPSFAADKDKFQLIDTDIPGCLVLNRLNRQDMDRAVGGLPGYAGADDHCA